MAKKHSIDPENYMPVQVLQDIRMRYQDRCRTELTDIHTTNFLWNLPILHRYPGILGWEDSLKGVPVVIAGLGPSLTKQIPLLREHRKKFLLVVGDACLPVLMGADVPEEDRVIPDVVVMVDPTEKQVENFKGIDTKLFYSVVPVIAHPAIFRVLDPKKTAVYNVKDPGSTILEQAPYHTGRKGALPAAVLTSGSAFCFSAVAGCNPILFIGQDLSWPSTERVYAEGTAEWKVEFQKSGKFRSECLLFPDIHGKLVLTHQTFVNFWAWMRDTCRHMCQRVVNCSEEGILQTKEIRPMPFAVAIERWCKGDLVGMEERLSKAYHYEVKDGVVEKLLRPKMKVKVKRR